MAGTAVNSTVVAGLDKPATPSQLTASVVNAFRISAVADRLANHICTNPKADAMEFFNLCLSLARGIDYAIANDEVPDKAPELPSILKKVCQHKNESLLLAAIMVLMISVKNACKRKWFSDKESEELHTLVNEIATSFTSAIDINTEATTFLSIISTIMSRFYPRMKMGHILAFLEVKSGYGAFVLDFHISKDTKSPPEEKIRLFVAQTDNTETSSCIVTPLNVNFLLNGKGVDRRTNVIMDTGPQNPTIVTQMLKYGTNLLQAVGQFNGNYIIAVAFMSVISDPIVPPALQDYVQPNVASLDSDSEVIEGPSRISLNCPISFSRIKTPVKGHLCKHLQCFDFENFVDINSRRPSWRCPHCNQNVCYTDIRIDQNMVKVLKEVGENVTDVIIFADGSWKAVIDSDEASDKQNQKTPICGLDGPTTDQQIPNPSNSGSDIMDLTQGDDPMDVINSVETEERKPSVNLQSQLNNLTEMYPNNPPPPPLPSVDDGFWSGIYLSTYGTGSNSDSQIIGGVSESAPANNNNSNNMTLSPALTDAVSGSSQNPNYHSLMLMHNLMLQQQQNSQLNSNINEYGQFPTGSSRQVNRTPIAVQALPVPTQPPPQQPSTQPAPQQRFLPVYGNSGVHQFPRPQNMNTHQHQVSQMNSAALHQVLGSQSRVRQEQQQQTFISTPPAQPQPQPQPPSQPPIISGLRASTQIPNRVGSLNEPTRVQPLHLRTQSPGLIRSPPAHMQRTPIHSQGVGGGGLPQSSSAGSLSSQHMRMMGSGSGLGQQRPTNFSIPVQPTQTPSPLGTSADRFRSNMGGGTGPIQQQHRADGSLVDPTAEQNWRPTGRMRGSLSGRAYSDAFNQFITSPAQPVQPTPRPSPPPGIGPQQLHVLATNNRNAHTSSPHPTANANVGGSEEGT